MGFRIDSGKSNRLSGSGDSGNFGGIYISLFGKILPKNNASGGFYDCGSLFQSSSGSNGFPFCVRTHWMEDRVSNFQCGVQRNYRFL